MSIPVLCAYTTTLLTTCHFKSFIDLVLLYNGWSRGGLEPIPAALSLRLGTPGQIKVLPCEYTMAVLYYLAEK